MTEAITISDRLAAAIRAVPDFPKPGILFRDITPVLKRPDLLGDITTAFAERFAGDSPTVIAAAESRGFLFGVPLAIHLGLPFVPIRKPGKLPSATLSERYALEYGEDTLEVHADAFAAGDRVLFIDDLLATGGTTAACLRLIERSSAKVAGCGFLIELAALDGRRHLSTDRVESLVRYDD